ncbi:solute carrier family 35 member F1 [Egretta garzetta]|nr:solute carrier family 35 member F1 [Egretta garzetta]
MNFRGFQSGSRYSEEANAIACHKPRPGTILKRTVPAEDARSAELHGARHPSRGPRRAPPGSGPQRPAVLPPPLLQTLVLLERSGDDPRWGNSPTREKSLNNVVYAVGLAFTFLGLLRQRELLDLLLSVALGQVLSLLICGIGLTSKYLSEDFHANTPVFQSFLNYILLFLVYTTTLAVRQGEENLLAILKRRWWKYMILGIIDIEANYLVVKAYQYTTLTSVQLLDCFVIPVVILLSWFFLLVRYKAVHFIGIVVCILGMGCMAGADVLVGRQQGAGENKLIGDLLVLGGATLYGISNVCEEYIVRNLSRVEFLGMIGLFGSFFSGIQLAIMEHKELLKVPWDWQIGLLYVGFSACMFGLYSFMPVVIKKTSATAVNLSLLTADLYSLFCGLFLFHYKFSGLYLLSFFTILVGLVLYSSTSTYVAQDPRVYKQFRNPSGPVVDLPATGQLEPSVTYTSLGQETEEEPHVRVA